MAEGGSLPAWVPATVGFLSGGGFLWIIDKILPHLHLGFPLEEAEGIKTSWHRSVLLVLAITLHNIPEGLAIGVAFGALASDLPTASLAGAVALALGIGIQNFPEGTAVSVPLRREGFTRLKSFWYGQLSGIVEPIAGVVGALAVILMKPLLPYALAFAAGAMIFVVGSGRTHSGISTGEKYRYRHNGCHGWVRRHDDFGCCSGIRVILKITSELKSARYNLQKQWSMLKVILHDLSNRPSVACKKSYIN
jgi:putative Mn2+ efflux pump MntP